MALIGTGIGAIVSYIKAVNVRKQQQNEELPEEKISLRALDKKIKEHDKRLDEIDLHLSATDRRLEDDHEEVMRQLRRIVGREPESR